VSLLFRRRRSSSSASFAFRFALDCDSLVLLLVSVDLEAEKLTFCGRSGRVEDESNNRESGRLLSLLVVLVLLVSGVLLSCWSKLELFVVALVPNKLCVNDSVILVEGVSYSTG